MSNILNEEPVILDGKSFTPIPDESTVDIKLYEVDESKTAVEWEVAFLEYFDTEGVIAIHLGGNKLLVTTEHGSGEED